MIVVAAILALSPVEAERAPWLISCIGKFEVSTDDGYSLRELPRKFEISYRVQGRTISDVQVKDAPTPGFDGVHSGRVEKDWQGRITGSTLIFSKFGERKRWLEPGMIRLQPVPGQTDEFRVEWKSYIAGHLHFSDAGTGVCQRMYLDDLVKKWTAQP